MYLLQTSLQLLVHSRRVSRVVDEQKLDAVALRRKLSRHMLATHRLQAKFVNVLRPNNTIQVKRRQQQQQQQQKFTITS